MSRLISAAGSRPLGSQDTNQSDHSHTPTYGAGHINALLAQHRPAAWARQPLDSLSRENSDSQFWQDLYDLGKEAERQNDPQLALLIYAYLGEQPISEPLSRLAKRAHSGVTGLGARAGDRLEHLGQSWLEQATDPAMMLGMLGAGLAFQGGRALSLRKLSQWGAKETFGTVGWKSFGALGGFAAEVPAFMLTSKIAAQGLGQPTQWQPKILLEEMMQTAMVLGPLKASGFLGRKVLQQLHGIKPGMGVTRGKSLYPITSKVIPQGIMLGGIMLGHGAQGYLAGQESPEFFTNLLDSMATLAQFQAAGKLLPTLAPGVQRITQSWDRYAEQLTTSAKSSGDFFVPGLTQWKKFAWATAGSGNILAKPLRAPSIIPTHTFMVGDTPLESSRSRGNALNRAIKAAHSAKQAQAGETTYPEALAQIKAVLREWVNGKPYHDFGDPPLNLLTKILLGKSLTPRALAYRFGGDDLTTIAKPYIFGDKLGFSIRIESNQKLVAHFDVDLLFKQVFLLGKWQSGWVAHRGRMYLQDHFKWRGYWTLLTLQLVEWARTGNFIAIESEASTDGGKASMADIFDVAKPNDFSQMKEQFVRRMAYEDFEFSPETQKRMEKLEHPWEIMEIQDLTGQKVGYDFLKNYPQCWHGILPVQGLASRQWNRLLHRAFVKKKLWQRDSRFPVPANTRVGQIKNNQDLLNYYLDHSTQRFLSSLQRMEDHLIEHSAPPETILGPIWRQYHVQRIRPLQNMIDEFRRSLRHLPQELANGELTTDTAVGLLHQAQADLLEFKVALRNVTANLYQDYLIYHRLGILENFLQESSIHFGRDETENFNQAIGRLRTRVETFQGDSPALLGKMELLKTIEDDVESILTQQSRLSAKKLLNQRWGGQPVPEVIVKRMAHFIREAFWNQFNGNRELLDRFQDMATTLATVYLDRPWNFAVGDSLVHHDLIWGMGTLRTMESPSFHKMQSPTYLLEQANENIRSLRALLPDHLPLFLVKGSHFKAPIFTPLGQDSNLTLVVSPSRSAFEGGISFSLYPNSQVAHLQKGRSRPLYQVVLRRHLHHQEFEILLPPQRHLQTPKNAQVPANPYQALKYLAVRWAQEQGLTTPGENYVLDLPYLPEWVPMIDAMNRLSFAPSEKLAGMEQSSTESQTAFKRLYDQNPFQISTQDSDKPK